jgi:UDP-arabinose 4-epimerase
VRNVRYSRRSTDCERPINPYGRSKLAGEQILADARAAEGLRVAVLRYFNPAGADPNGDLAERHDPETHLIPLAIDAATGDGAFDFRNRLSDRRRDL